MKPTDPLACRRRRAAACPSSKVAVLQVVIDHSFPCAAAKAGASPFPFLPPPSPCAGRCMVLGSPGRRRFFLSLFEFIQKILIPVQPVIQPVIR